MKVTSCLAAAGLTVLTWGNATFFAHAEDQPRHYVKLAERDPQTASKDAQADYKKGICPLYATGGYTWMLLGTDTNVYDAKSKYIIFYDSQTSDVISDDAAIQDRARAYAETYNKAAVKNCGIAK